MLWMKSHGSSVSSRRRTPAQAIEPLHGFDWRNAEPRKLRPFKPIYHITMGKCAGTCSHMMIGRDSLTLCIGLQSDALSNLITIDKDYLSRINLRRDLLARYADTVHGCLPEGADAVREVYTFLLRDYLPQRFPSIFARSRDAKSLTNTATQRTYPCTPAKAKTDSAAAAAAAALRSLAEVVEEDMFILRETPDGHRCVAFLCCFPSGFNPSSKLGMLLREVHAPVPAYDRIGQSMERFFARLEVGKGVKRVNVSSGASSPWSLVLQTWGEGGE